MRKTLTDRGVAALKARPQRYAVADPQQPGLLVRVTPSGARSFVAVARRPDGRQVWLTLGDASIGIGAAREQAREALRRIRAGLPARESPAESFQAVAENWLRRHVEPNRLRSERKIIGLLKRHILPEWADREFTAIRRGDVAALLDRIQDQASARQADAALTIISSVMRWRAARSDDYSPPLTRGMKRQRGHEHERERILTDDELRAVWAAAGQAGTFGAAVRICLLTAQRRAKVFGMRRDDVIDGEWRIQTEVREKHNAETLLLPPAALVIIAAQPRYVSNLHVFASAHGTGPIASLSRHKASLDAASGVTGWVLHDLRRTSRSLMSRAGVRPDVAERVLGHAVPGIARVYDRHQYCAEKAEALAKLAQLIQDIVTSRVVVPLRRPSQIS